MEWERTCSHSLPCHKLALFSSQVLASPLPLHTLWSLTFFLWGCGVFLFVFVCFVHRWFFLFGHICYFSSFFILFLFFLLLSPVVSPTSCLQLSFPMRTLHPHSSEEKHEKIFKRPFQLMLQKALAQHEGLFACTTGPKTYWWLHYCFDIATTWITKICVARNHERWSGKFTGDHWQGCSWDPRSWQRFLSNSTQPVWFLLLFQCWREDKKLSTPGHALLAQADVQATLPSDSMKYQMLC